MDLWDALYILNVGFIVIIFLIHLRFTRYNVQANRMMSLFLFCLGYISLMLLLFSSRWILRVPHFYRTGNFFIYLMYPSAYLYVRKIMNQEGWKRSDLLHFIPALLYLVDYSPFFLLSAHEKMAQLRADYAGDKLYTFPNSWFLPHYFHFNFRSLLAFVYVFLIARIWFSRKFDRNNVQFNTENKSLMQWIATLNILLLIGTIPSVIIVFLGIPVDLTKTANSFTYITTTSYAFFLLFRPDIIYGVKGLWVEDLFPQVQEKHDEASEVQVAGGKTPRSTYLNTEAVTAIGLALEKYLSESKAFLANGYTISDLSKGVGYPTHQISAFLNHHLGLNFNEYINKLRIEYLVSDIVKNEDWQNYTLEALGHMVGFNNRYSFSKSFKQNTGKTPSEYFKGLKRH